MPKACILNQISSSFAFRAEKKSKWTSLSRDSSSCQFKLPHTPDKMIVPQIKPSNLCIKLGHKAYFFFPSPRFTAPVHISALYYTQKKTCWRADLCRWHFSISTLCYKHSWQPAWNLNQNKEYLAEVLSESVTVKLLPNPNAINIVILLPPLGFVFGFFFPLFVSPVSQKSCGVFFFFRCFSVPWVVLAVSRPEFVR